MKIEKLLKAAESAEKKANSINTEVSGNWTHRRQSFADRAQKKKDNLLLYADILRKLHSQWVDKTITDEMKHIGSVADIEHIRYGYFPNPPQPTDPVDGWYAKEYPSKLNKCLKKGIRSEEDFKRFKDQLKSYLEKTETEEEVRERKLKAAILEIRGARIPGFFPTPDALIDEMIELANIEDHHTILEPSAGIGHIADKIAETRKHFPNPKLYIDCCEYVYSLANILMLKGYNVISNDIFNAIANSGSSGINHGYDRIIMNPPFEKNQDIEHIRYCFDKFLKKGGRLVSVASMSWTFNTNKVSEEFRKFLGVGLDEGAFRGTKYMQKLDSQFETETHQLKVFAKCLPFGAFEEAFNSTSVQTTLIVIDKK